VAQVATLAVAGQVVMVAGGEELLEFAAVRDVETVDVRVDGVVA